MSRVVSGLFWRACPDAIVLASHRIWDVAGIQRGRFNRLNLILELAIGRWFRLELANTSLFLNPLAVSGRSAKCKIEVALAFHVVGVHCDSDQPITR